MTKGCSSCDSSPLLKVGCKLYILSISISRQAELVLYTNDGSLLCNVIEPPLLSYFSLPTVMNSLLFKSLTFSVLCKSYSLPATSTTSSDYLAGGPSASKMSCISLVHTFLTPSAFISFGVPHKLTLANSNQSVNAYGKSRAQHTIDRNKIRDQ